MTRDATSVYERICGAPDAAAARKKIHNSLKYDPIVLLSCLLGETYGRQFHPPDNAALAPAAVAVARRPAGMMDSVLGVNLTTRTSWTREQVSCTLS